ncbi:hypothetical protein ACHAW5_008108, partial [Stephanodiscus triporus]
CHHPSHLCLFTIREARARIYDVRFAAKVDVNSAGRAGDVDECRLCGWCRRAPPLVYFPRPAVRCDEEACASNFFLSIRPDVLIFYDDASGSLAPASIFFPLLALAAHNTIVDVGYCVVFTTIRRSHTHANVATVRALTAIRERTTTANPPDDEGSVRTHGTTATPRSMSSISTTPTVEMATAVTPGSILPRNDFRRAASILHDATTAAIREIDHVAANEYTPARINGRTTIITMLKTLLDDGIQDRRIARATVAPQLEQAAARIAAVVEAECPANRPTLKGLIHDDVDKTTDDLRRRIQSLEAKLGETKNALKRTTTKSGEPSMPQRKKVKNEVGGATKSNKTPGTAVAPSSATFPKNKSWKRTAQKKPTNKPTTNPPTTPADSNNASTAASKKARKKATGRKSGGKGRGKPTAVDYRINNFLKGLRGLFCRRAGKHNLTPHQRQLLTSLQENKSIVIANADKNFGTAERDIDDLRKEIHAWTVRHRSSLPDDTVNFIREHMDKSMADPLEYFYLLIKLHKLPIAGRPICSDCGSLPHALGRYVDTALQPIVKDQALYFKNSAELKTEELESLTLPANASLFTYDALLLEALELVMFNNRMRFGDIIVKQLSGIAMGMSPAPTIANLYVAIYEELHVLKYIPLPVLYLRRFIDDGFGIWLHDPDPVGGTMAALALPCAIGNAIVAGTVYGAADVACGGPDGPPGGCWGAMRRTESQALGRLRNSYSSLLLAHQRLVGLGRRVDRSYCEVEVEASTGGGGGGGTDNNNNGDDDHDGGDDGKMGRPRNPRPTSAVVLGSLLLSLSLDGRTAALVPISVAPAGLPATIASSSSSSSWRRKRRRMAPRRDGILRAILSDSNDANRDIAAPSPPAEIFPDDLEGVARRRRRRRRTIAAALGTFALALLASTAVDSEAAVAATTTTTTTKTAMTENQRLVADVWSAVSSQYFDPSFNGLGESGWRDREMEAIARVAEAGPDDDALVEAVVAEMLSALDDRYTRFLPREKFEALTAYATGGNYRGGGIGVQLLEDARTGRVTVMATAAGGPAAVAGVRPGDAIVGVDGADVAGSSAEVVAAKCRGEAGGTVEVDFLRGADDDGADDGGGASVVATGGGTMRHLALTRARIDANPIEASTFVSAGGRRVGLLRVPSFSTETAGQIVDGLRSVTTTAIVAPSSIVYDGGGGRAAIDAIAIDIRGNVGGYMPGGVDAAKLFLPAGDRIISEVGRSGTSSKTYNADGIGAETSLPVYVLVDKRTASAAEIFAAALQDNGRAIVVGTTNTFGKGRIQNVRPLGNGCGVAVTRARYVTPRGRDLHGVGIVPNKEPGRAGGWLATTKQKWAARQMPKLAWGDINNIEFESTGSEGGETPAITDATLMRKCERYPETSEALSSSSVMFQSDVPLSPCNDRRHEDRAGGGGGGRRRRRRARQRHPKIGVIGANPSQSKHLETATMKIHGIDVDFVNLRANEVYGADSRIPTFETTGGSSCGPAFLRRDLTINSLFYNVRTGKIEDWTGRGLDDLLRRRLVVTPVDPHVTFHDDPLRVLRAIRFAVRLDFALDGSIVEAAMSRRVHRSLHAKVSRERVGKELEGMLSGKHARPGRALDAIARLHLAGSVFAFPGTFPGDQERVGGPVRGRILGVDYACVMDASAAAGVNEDIDDRGDDVDAAVELAARHRERGWEESRLLLSVLPTLMRGHVDEREKITARRVDSAADNADVAQLTSADSRLLYLCVFILPFHDLTFTNKKGQEVFVTAHMVKEAIKFPLRDTQAVSKILSHVDELATILSEFRSQLTQEGGGDAPWELTPPCRLRVGLLLRSLKEHWVTCLITAAAWEIRTYPRPHEGEKDRGILTSLVPEDLPSRELFRVIVDDLDLDGCWRVRPHLNGKDLIKELGRENASIAASKRKG